ncbi:MAG: hypothetical protein ACFFAJ_15980 [Candidatus Hodarchaeota archaeon]
MKNRTCHMCDQPFYANYKGKYYCVKHLENVLAEEKRVTKKKT